MNPPLVFGLGVLSALLDQQAASSSSEKLRVLFCGDSVVQPNTGLMSTVRQDARVHPSIFHCFLTAAISSS